MSFGGIQFGGLASGLDTGAIIDAIMAVESRAMRAIESRKDQEQQKLTLLGTFEGLVNALRDKARDLKADSNFFAHELTVGEEGIATFTLSGSATAGAHTLEVLSLASADRWAFAGVADPEASLGAGTISFTYDGTAYSVGVLAGSDNLNDIAAAINAAAGADVTATVVNVGTESTPSYQLVVNGDDTGADFALTGLTSSVAGLSGATQVSVASNARAIVDGLAVERSTNLFSDVLPGISFSVSRTTTVGAPLSFSVALDPAGIKENIQEFVDAYNEVVKFVNGQSSFSEDDGPGGELFGDNALDAVRGVLRRALFSVSAATVAADADGYSTLGRIGIELQGDGTLSIDDETLDEKLNGDLDRFSDFFRFEGVAEDFSDSGIFVRVDELLDGLLDDSSFIDALGESHSVDGLFDARRVAVGKQIRAYDDEIDQMQFRLDKLEESLIAKFSTLEQLMSGLQTQQAFLASAFSGLPR